MTSGAVVSSSSVPVAHRRPAWLTWAARVVNVLPAVTSSRSTTRGAPASAARTKTMWAETGRRPGAWRPAATMAWASIWLPSTTGRRQPARATLT
jgi:hypothetical protein